MSGQPTVAARFLGCDEFPRLLTALTDLGYTVVGPTVRDGAIIYDEIHATSDLPLGISDEQDGGTYRLRRRDDQALFGFVVGPHSWKQFLHPPRLRLWQARRNGPGGFEIDADAGAAAPRYAFLGVRACELHAIQIQDRVFLTGAFIDPAYRVRREQALIVAVNCVEAGGTCFCASMQTGPRAGAGYDLALTEVIAPERHYFIVEAGSETGTGVLDGLEFREATPDETGAAGARVEAAAQAMGRQLDTAGVRELLRDEPEHPRWEEVARRCINCANCTLVCPTCFCSTVEDTTDLTGDHAKRWRRWDSCFTMDFSYVHGGSVRSSARARYRHWLTHKLSTWHDQYGTSGCVGCGRCVTWCPVAIDLTEEVAALRRPQADTVPGGTDA